MAESVNQLLKSESGAPVLNQQNHYTQINLWNDSSANSLPANYESLPTEAQAMVLEMAKREQQMRHAWVEREQQNSHHLDRLNSTQDHRFKIYGLVGGIFLSVFLTAAGVFLIYIKCSAIGISVIFTAVSGVVLATIYGKTHKEKPVDKKPAAEEGQA